MITLSSCFYIIKSKFDVKTYQKWIDIFLNGVINFNLVIYTNEESKWILNKYKDNNKIKIVIKEFEEFYNYKYKKEWIKNNTNNKPLHHVDWKLEMLWAEKIAFVRDTINNKYFETDWYGWCDIGYFRFEMDKYLLKKWINPVKINKLNQSKIYYTQVCSRLELKKLCAQVNNVNVNGLPNPPIKLLTISIAGGFFLIHKDNIKDWFDMFDNMLIKYFKNNYLVNDDQIIILNCYGLNKDKFELIKETGGENPWFAFKRFLS